MNHAGEIRELCAIAWPRVGVVTNVGHAHMEAFDSIEGVAAAKRELIESLPADGVAVLNADDPLRSPLPGSAFRPDHHFWLHAKARTFARSKWSTGYKASVSVVDGVPFESQLVGRHSVLNILAGLAVASIYGIRPESTDRRGERALRGQDARRANPARRTFDSERLL